MSDTLVKGGAKPRTQIPAAPKPASCKPDIIASLFDTSSYTGQLATAATATLRCTSAWLIAVPDMESLSVNRNAYIRSVQPS